MLSSSTSETPSSEKNLVLEEVSSTTSGSDVQNFKKTNRKNKNKNTNKAKKKKKKIEGKKEKKKKKPSNQDQDENVSEEEKENENDNDNDSENKNGNGNEMNRKSNLSQSEEDDEDEEKVDVNNVMVLLKFLQEDPKVKKNKPSLWKRFQTWRKRKRKRKRKKQKKEKDVESEMNYLLSILFLFYPIFLFLCFFTHYNLITVPYIAIYFIIMITPSHIYTRGVKKYQYLNFLLLICALIISLLIIIGQIVFNSIPWENGENADNPTYDGSDGQEFYSMIGFEIVSGDAFKGFLVLTPDILLFLITFITLLLFYKDHKKNFEIGIVEKSK
ncbi:neurofilament triplet m protein-like protein [Anaeramoeba flamelloides]|uniref:Neurofilament triplet m protein-like protein n=1 Tax=Anaeramoeba flamelloides TaxID=1746091 RepID=A0AAV7ZV38_9EUKA|nr:neurofilament triplet m protein-like protein [Anaeramoeba flamelloides]